MRCYKAVRVTCSRDAKGPNMPKRERSAVALLFFAGVLLQTVLVVCHALAHLGI